MVILRTPKKILISCAGLGMGNASRISSLLESLVEQSSARDIKISLKVLSWGAGHAFLKEFKKECSFDFELTELKKFSNLSILNFIRTFASNSVKLSHEINHFLPDIIILDSDYHLPGYFFKKCPRIFIGQAIDVLERAKTNNYQFQSFAERLNMFFREKLDSIYQLIVSDAVIVPSFNLRPSNNPKIKKVSLIIRKEFLMTKAVQVTANKIAILLSGSEIDKEFFLTIEKTYNIKIFTPNNYQSSFLSHSSELDEYDVIFTQGGLTSISEVLSRKKFLVVFPIQNHPEQILNAIEVEKMGLGMRAHLSDLNDFKTFSKKVLKKKTEMKTGVVQCSGATEGALVIMDFLSRNITT
jgi:uncharacterized protein (TIGR00661 family)